MLAMHRHPVAVEQTPDGDEHLFQRCDRGRGLGAHLLHPGLHPVSDAWQHPTRSEPAQRRDLHRRDRRVAGDRGQNSDAHPQPVGHGQRRRRQTHAGGVEAVLDDPELIRSAVLEAPSELGHQRRREGSVEADSDLGATRSHRRNLSSAADNAAGRVMA